MSQISMFDSQEEEWSRIEMPDADVRILRGFVKEEESASVFRELRDAKFWRQDKIEMYGKTYLVPRLQQWFADPGLGYTWSRIKMDPEPWTPLLLDLKSRVEKACNWSFNSVLANLYRSGADTVAWHSDDEKEFGKHPFIASLSFGAEREFLLRHRSRRDLDDVKILLPSGSLLVMAGSTQDCWLHSLPRRKHVMAERVNLTFRRVVGY